MALVEPDGPADLSSTAVHAARVSRARSRWAIWVFPVLVVLVAAVLTAFNLNGSSLALLSFDWRADPALVAGTPRTVRADEYSLSSPAQIGNEKKDYPSHSWLGLTDIEYGVTSLGVPTRTWIAAFQPDTWPRLLPGGERGFAAGWWIRALAGLLGLYALLLALRRRPLAAATVAVVIGLSPLTAWWVGSGPALVVGLLSAGGAAFLVGMSTRSPRTSALWGLAAGYFICTGFFLLYPPWFVSVALVVAAVVVGAAVERRVPLRRFAIVAASAILVVAAVLGAWGLQSASALDTIRSTIYPGARLSVAGEGSMATLTSAPLNPIMANDPTSLEPAEYANQSELSAPWFPAPVVLVLLVLVAVRLRVPKPVDSPEREGATRPPWAVRDWAAALAVTAVLIVLLAWMFLPLPDIVGALTLLNRVPSRRVTLAVGLAVGLLIHLLAGRLPSRWPRWELPALAVAVALSAAVTYWSASALLVADAQGVAWSAAIAVVVAIAVAGFCTRRTAWPFALLLVVVVLGNWLIVNPLYRGTGPLGRGPLAKLVASLAERDGPTRWVSLVGGNVTAVVAASPSVALSGMTYYPTRDVWERLAPTQPDLWNNYAKYTWIHDPSARPAVIRQVNGTVMELRIDLCSDEVAFLDIDYVVTEREQPPPCFEPVAKVRDLGERLTISRRS